MSRRLPARSRAIPALLHARTRAGRQKRGMDAAVRLVGDARERKPRALSARERAVFATLGVAFIPMTAALGLFLPSERPFDVWVAAALVVLFALASRVVFEVGNGWAVA